MDRYCAACEREKAKLPVYREIAMRRAREENRIIIVYFDTEDKKYKTMAYEETQEREVVEYFIP